MIQNPTSSTDHFNEKPDLHCSLESKCSTKSPLFHAHTIWLFVHSNWKDTIIPCSLFGLFGALSGNALNLPPPDLGMTFSRYPLAILWLWLILFQFCIGNQCRPGDIAEDAVNKPWRPLPAKRISVTQAKRLLAVAYLMASTCSIYLGVIKPYIAWTLFSYYYNEMRASDRSGLHRNCLNASGYSCMLSGPLRIIAGPYGIRDGASIWVLMIVLVVATTSHAQEFPDEEGDSARGRKTLITMLGNTLARITIVIGVMFWSVFIPAWLQLRWTMASVPTMLGLAVGSLALRGVWKRTPSLDMRTYNVWCCWFGCLCFLPLMKVFNR